MNHKKTLLYPLTGILCNSDADSSAWRAPAPATEYLLLKCGTLSVLDWAGYDAADF